MKKIFGATLILLFTASLVALPVMAQSSTSSTSTPPVAINLSCIQKAVDSRETTLINAVTTRSNAVIAALNARKSALNSAWQITVAKDRKTAIKKAWSDYRATLKSANSALRTARLAAWKQYNSDRKACGSATVKADYSDHGADSGL